ncbi:hypothetical protein QO206_03245 [Leeuwenhoekiella aequorea]|uniref:hypothetical protein n=1 Tax=Leeuwenhoekiella aequorea TaxID=283736 RepID=UPI00352CD51B|tara:strand:+ start:7713 stop:8150 length:438 start_codon:yes stop_codon:yes gene_type:complete
MKANKKQKQLIHVNAANRDTKEEWVQWATNDNSKISTNDLTFAQANMILKQMGLKTVPMATEDLAHTWGKFDKNNQQHKAILSLLRQIKWTTNHPRFGQVSDITRFGAWLQSDKSPVNKALLKMSPDETSKTIIALEGILKSLYK